MSNDDEAMARATLPARLAAIEQAQALAVQFCSRITAAHAAAVTNLPLVLEELITNSVLHGRAEGADAIEIVLRCQHGHLCLDYMDNGAPFDPRVDVPADPRATLTTTEQVGGLGWPLITHYFEVRDYRRASDRNVLQLVSRI